MIPRNKFNLAYVLIPSAPPIEEIEKKYKKDFAMDIIIQELSIKNEIIINQNKYRDNKNQCFIRLFKALSKNIKERIFN